MLISLVTFSVSSNVNFLFSKISEKLAYNVPRLQEVANFGTNYFLLKIKILAKCERELTTKFAISCNRCYMPFFLFSISILLIFWLTFHYLFEVATYKYLLKNYLLED